jgi:MFS family permease
MFGETIPQSFQPLFIGSLGVSTVTITLIYNIRNIIQTVLKLFAGPFRDSLGARNLMIFGLALFALIPFIYSIATSPWILVVAMMASGLAVSIFFLSCEEYISTLFSPGKANEVMGRYRQSWGISYVIGPLMGGFLVRYYFDYKTIFVLSGLLTCIGFFIAWRFTEDDRERSCPFPPIFLIQQNFHEFPTNLKRLLTNPKVIIACITAFTYAFCHFALIIFIPFFGTGRGFNEFLIGMALTAYYLMITINQPIIGRVSDKIRRFLALAIGLCTSIVAFALIPVTFNFWMFLLLNAALGISAVLVFPISKAIMMDAVPLEDIDFTTMIWGMVMSFGGAVGMFLMSGILMVASINWVFYSSSFITLLFTVVIVLKRRHLIQSDISVNKF